jgi:hypothetical protein
MKYVPPANHCSVSNPEFYAFLIGRLDRYVLQLPAPICRWASCGGDAAKRRAYLVGFTRERDARPLRLP